MGMRCESEGQRKGRLLVPHLPGFLCGVLPSSSPSSGKEPRASCLLRRAPLLSYSPDLSYFILSLSHQLSRLTNCPE